MRPTPTSCGCEFVVSSLPVRPSISDQQWVSPIRNLAIGLLSRRDYSTRELRLRLQRKLRAMRQPPASAEAARAITSVLKRLSDERLLDDRRLARRLACRDRAAKCHGDARIRRDLAARGIDAATITFVLSDIPDQDETLGKALALWVERHGRPATRANLPRLYRHLVRLGYRPSDVRRRLAPFFGKCGAPA